jgi:hypothetical protein
MDTKSETEDNIKIGIRELVISKCVVDSTGRVLSHMIGFCNQSYGYIIVQKFLFFFLISC